MDRNCGKNLLFFVFVSLLSFELIVMATKTSTELIGEDVQTLRASFSSGKTRSAEWRMSQLVCCFVVVCF